MTLLQESIEVPRPQHEVFAYIARFNTTQEWDATVLHARKITAGPIAVGTRFEVRCSAAITTIDLDYEVTALDPPNRIELRGRARLFEVIDRIEFSPTASGTRIDYRAEFHFPPALRGLSRFMEGALQRMGRTSMAGLQAALEDNFDSPTLTLGNSLRDRTIVPGLAQFTRLGYRRGQRQWQPLSAHLGGKHVVITGATSGLGRAAAVALARRGAALTLVVRDRERGQSVCDEIAAETGNTALRLEIADLSLLREVAALVRRLRRRGEPVDVLINNAGALFPRREETAEGIEKSLALLLLSPWQLTRGLKPLLEAAAAARVVNVVSGGMFSQTLDVARLRGGSDERYSGPAAYARAKRALMVVTEEWAAQWEDAGIVVNAMHPGWADTPGVRSALPGFHRLTRRLLRTPEQGADTIVWLASATEAGGVTGQLFLDREPHHTHLLPSTRESAAERAALMAYLADVQSPAKALGRGASTTAATP